MTVHRAILLTALALAATPANAAPDPSEEVVQTVDTMTIDWESDYAYLREDQILDAVLDKEVLQLRIAPQDRDRTDACGGVSGVALIKASRQCPPVLFALQEFHHFAQASEALGYFDPELAPPSYVPAILDAGAEILRQSEGSVWPAQDIARALAHGLRAEAYEKARDNTAALRELDAILAILRETRVEDTQFLAFSAQVTTRSADTLARIEADTAEPTQP